jgi:quinol monooxygenase YgiN
MFGTMLERLLTEGVNAFDEEGPGGARISVIAEIHAKAGHEEEIRVILHELVAPSRAEPGCEIYHLLEDKKQPGSFSTYEEWANVASLRQHLSSASAKAALEKAQPMLDGEMKLTIFRKLL